MNKNILFVLLMSCSFALTNGKRVKRIVGGQFAAAPPPDDPVVFAKLYGRNARVEGFRNKITGLYSFLGIHFAHPPIAADRFMRPNYKHLSGDINATQYALPCPQPDPQSGYMVGDEDCLWLNVFTPQLSDGTNSLPVLVWIHGGGYRYGSANQYGPDALTNKGVVFVAIQYRLGTLGILGDGTTEFSGNAALFDMGAALRWVSEYIEFFGGDPKRVTIVGHGSGASAAMYLTTSPVPRDSVSGVVAMSGTAYTQYSIDDSPAQSMQEIAKVHRCPLHNETELVKCLRAKKTDDIIMSDTKLQIERLQGREILRSMSGNVGFAPSVEQQTDRRSLPGFIVQQPVKVIQNGTFKRVPLLTGVTRDETANGFLLEELDQIFQSTTKFLNTLTTNLPVAGPLLGNITGKLLPGVGKLTTLTDYLTIPIGLPLSQILAKITEATTDVLFNLPAILTAQSWSKLAPVYLYSFEYVGKSKTSGASFLNGLPLVTKSKRSQREKLVAHGDELSYLFDARDLFGQPLQKNSSQLSNDSDRKISDTFTNLIAKFAYQTSDTSKNEQNKAMFQEYDVKNNNFIKIGGETSVQLDFRFCQLSLWGAKLEPASKETSCTFILDQLASTLLSTTTNLTNALGGTLDSAVSGLGLGGKKKPANNGQKNGGLLGLGIL